MCVRAVRFVLEFYRRLQSGGVRQRDGIVDEPPAMVPAALKAVAPKACSLWVLPMCAITGIPASTIAFTATLNFHCLGEPSFRKRMPVATACCTDTS